MIDTHTHMYITVDFVGRREADTTRQRMWVLPRSNVYLTHVSHPDISPYAYMCVCVFHEFIAYFIS